MSFPLGTNGWRTNVSGSLARSESVVKGKDGSDLAIRGESAALTWDVSKAWVLTAPWLAGTTLGVSKHRSKTFLDQTDVPLLDRQSRKLSLLGTLEYDTPGQKGGLRGTYNVASETKNYRYAELTGQWRHALDDAGLWFAKGTGLLRLKPQGELSSMDRFYLGGQDSVRGFSLGAGSGERGAATQLEIRRSLRDWGGDSGEAYVFWDAGLAKDSSRAVDDRLRSAGLGIQLKMNDSLGLDAMASRQLSTPQASPSRLLLRLVYSH
jgi:hemolysin activation/secretion protein